MVDIFQLSWENFLKVCRQIIQLYFKSSILGYLILFKTAYPIAEQKNEL